MLSFKDFEDQQVVLPDLEIDQELVDHVRKLGGLGLTNMQISHYYGHTTEQWRIRLKRNPELDMAMKQGKAHSIKKVSSKLWEWIEKNDKASIMFYLKTQAGWRETGTSEEDDKLDKKEKNSLASITLPLDQEEASKIYQQIMKEDLKNERNSTSK